jgi:exopolyphosphatase/guanosine-5'-triphosphate,3'-diphosphate pyrophosphatase
VKILRLAILLNGQRNDAPLLDIKIEPVDKDHWKLNCDNPEWLTENKLLAADLTQEQELWDQVDWQLSFDNNGFDDNTEAKPS